MERGFVRRPSTTESTASSGCDVTFDDLDDSQVFAYLDEGDEQGSMKAAASRTVEFRLDFSSRVNPAPSTTSTSPSPVMSRRSSTNALLNDSKQSSASTTTGRVLQRSPSMRSNTLPFRKRLSRRPSEPVSESILAAAITTATSIRPESPLSSPVSPSPPRSPALVPASVGPTIASPTKSSGSPVPRPAVHSVDDSIASAQHAAMAAASSEIVRLQTINESLREELSAARSHVDDLQERVRLAEQHNESLSDQLIAVQDAFEAKLRAAYDDAVAEREDMYNQKKSELQSVRERSEQERETLEREMKEAVAKIESELQSDADQLQRLMRDGKEQTNALKAQITALQAELKASQFEKQQLSESDASLVAKCESLQHSADHWEAECQRLQDQVHQLLHEQEHSRQCAFAEKQEMERKQTLDKAVQRRVGVELQQLQCELKALAVGAQELIKAEGKKTTQLLTRVQQQASELAIQHNEKAMALVVKQNRIIQLETQLKNERQSVNQLDTSLAKATRALQKKDELFRSKYQEQKEFLDITVAVRNGLTNELQNKKKKLEEMENQLKETLRARDAVEKKNKHLTQQVKIMQHMHAREMEQVALLRQGQQCDSRRRNSLGGCSNASSHTTSRAQKPKVKGATAMAATSASRVVGATYKFSSLREPRVEMTTNCRASAEAEEAVAAVDQDDNGRRCWFPEDDVLAAEEWREFVAIVALHEAECRHQLQQQAQAAPGSH